ncbi:hypothetical protein KRX57_02450 [Weeksellaceae bacterium TAE3-ERU29]|nr:hypothetical protein [Weeksellaceae bacterium TAE3-ERU29]
MIIPKHTISDTRLTQLIGNPLKHKLTPIGSGAFILKSFSNSSNNNDTLNINSRCNFEKREKGLLLYINYKNNLSLIPLPIDEIINITLKKGEEKINPRFLSFMWILLKIGVPISFARYFEYRSLEYSIKPTELSISTKKYNMTFISNGYKFEEQAQFFKSLKYRNILIHS